VWWERLDKVAVAAGFTGFLGLVLVMVMASGVWYEAIFRASTGKQLSNSEAIEGTAYVEGKVVFLLALCAAVAVGASVVRREWLPWSLTAAGACSAFFITILWALWGRLAAQYQSAAESVRGATSLSGGPSWALVLCLMSALIAAVAFIVAVRREPPQVPVLQEPTYPDVVQRYGGIIGSYLVAFILGVGFAIIRR
jgi:hypothetical protein